MRYPDNVRWSWPARLLLVALLLATGLLFLVVVSQL